MYAVFPTMQVSTANKLFLRNRNHSMTTKIDLLPLNSLQNMNGQKNFMHCMKHQPNSKYMDSLGMYRLYAVIRSFDNNLFGYIVLKHIFAKILKTCFYCTIYTMARLQ